LTRSPNPSEATMSRTKAEAASPLREQALDLRLRGLLAY
jgi:hypothetical protein